MASFQPVDFDLDGALALARKLWDLGQTVETLRGRRDRHVEIASKEWSGPYGDVFRLEASEEQDRFTSTKTALQDAAESWAEAWARAKDENNRREHEAGPAPGPVSVPSSPGFFPTD